MSDAETVETSAPLPESGHAMQQDVLGSADIADSGPRGRRRAPKRGGVYSEIQDLRGRLQEHQLMLEAIRNALSLAASSLSDWSAENGRHGLTNELNYQLNNHFNNVNNLNSAYNANDGAYGAVNSQHNSQHKNQHDTGRHNRNGGRSDSRTSQPHYARNHDGRGHARAYSQRSAYTRV